MLEMHEVRDISEKIAACREHIARAQAEQTRIWADIEDVKKMNMSDPAVGHRLDVLEAQINLLQRVFGFP